MHCAIIDPVGSSKGTPDQRRIYAPYYDYEVREAVLITDLIGIMYTDHEVIDKFNNKQRAYFSGAVKSLNANGNTATYDAVAVGLKMLLDKAEEVPDASLVLFVLSDGVKNRGLGLNRIKPIVGGLHIPVYCIGYNMNNTKELKELAEINEAALINADSDDIVNQLRNLFNVNM